MPGHQLQVQTGPHQPPRSQQTRSHPAIGFDNLGCAEAVSQYEKRGVIVYERVSSSLDPKRMLDSFGLEGAIRVSPLHCNSESDIDRFLAITQEISEAFMPATNHASAA